MKGIIELESYYKGFADGSNCKYPNPEFMICGYKLSSILKLIEADELRKLQMQHEKKKMTRKEAIECFKKYHVYGDPNDTIDFYIEAGMLEIVEESYIDARIVEALAKSRIYGSAVMMELDRAGFKIVEK